MSIEVVAQTEEGKYYIHRGTDMPKNAICPAPLIDGGKAKSWHFDEGIIEMKEGKALVNKSALVAFKLGKTRESEAVKNKASDKSALIAELKVSKNPEIIKLLQVLGL